jgi:hypothetical protein
MSNSKLGSDKGGYVAVAAELKRVSCSASAIMEWNIPNFISLFESMDQNVGPFLRKSSPSFAIRCGQIERKFQLFIKKEAHNDWIGLCLRKLSGADAEVEFQLKAVGINGTNLGIGELKMNKFTKNSSAWGYREYISLQKLKDNPDNFLPNGSLKLVCELKISDNEVFMEGCEGKTLNKDLDNLRRDQTLSDFKIICKDKVFQCHKNILAARYLNIIHFSPHID